MCGRFLLISSAGAIGRRFGIDPRGLTLAPRYNIAPGQDIPVITGQGEGRRLRFMRWGLMPPWLTEPPGRPLVNARIETVADRPAFRAAFRHRRCLVPADGWYEWQPQPHGPKQPFVFLARAADSPFALAALYEEAHTARWGETVPETVTLLTMPARPAFATIHDRMPVPLAPESFAAWLDPQHPPCPDDLAVLPEDAFATRPVSRLVNRVSIDGPVLLEPDHMRPAHSPSSSHDDQGDLFA